MDEREDWYFVKPELSYNDNAEQETALQVGSIETSTEKSVEHIQIEHPDNSSVQHLPELLSNLNELESTSTKNSSSDSDIDIIDENVKESIPSSFLRPWTLPIQASVDSIKLPIVEDSLNNTNESPCSTESQSSCDRQASSGCYDNNQDLNNQYVPEIPVSNFPVSQSMLQQSSPSATNVLQPAVASPAPPVDSKKSKLVKPRFELLLHAHKCHKREKQSNGEGRQCSFPDCQTMKDVLSHMPNCLAGKSCQVKYCFSTRQLLSHFKIYTRCDCPVCLLLKLTSDRHHDAEIISSENLKIKLLEKERYTDHSSAVLYCLVFLLNAILYTFCMLQTESMVTGVRRENEQLRTEIYNINRKIRLSNIRGSNGIQNHMIHKLTMKFEEQDNLTRLLAQQNSDLVKDINMLKQNKKIELLSIEKELDTKLPKLIKAFKKLKDLTKELAKKNNDLLIDVHKLKVNVDIMKHDSVQLKNYLQYSNEFSGFYNIFTKPFTFVGNIFTSVLNIVRIIFNIVIGIFTGAFNFVVNIFKVMGNIFTESFLRICVFFYAVLISASFSYFCKFVVIFILVCIITDKFQRVRKSKMNIKNK